MTTLARTTGGRRRVVREPLGVQRLITTSVVEAYADGSEAAERVAAYLPRAPKCPTEIAGGEAGGGEGALMRPTFANQRDFSADP